MGIKVTNLSITIEKNKILDDITINFLPGKFSVISGPNGPGKTTLLRAIMGLMPIESGEIFLNNININTLSVRKKSLLIGYVPQSSQRDFDFTVFETVKMGGYALGKENKRDIFDREVDEALELTGMEKFKNRIIGTLSGGELQRVLLSRALLGKPKYLIFDEPYSNLDISHFIEMINLVKKVTSQMETTTLIVLHDLPGIYRFADNVTLLNKGKIYASGDTREIITTKNLKEVFNISTQIIRDSRGIEHLVLL